MPKLKLSHTIGQALLLLAVLLLFTECVKKEEYPDQPEISVEGSSVVWKQDTILGNTFPEFVVFFKFTDGTGLLGYDQNERPLAPPPPIFNDPGLDTTIVYPNLNELYQQLQLFYASELGESIDEEDRFDDDFTLASLQAKHDILEVSYQRVLDEIYYGLLVEYSEWEGNGFVIKENVNHNAILPKIEGFGGNSISGDLQYAIPIISRGSDTLRFSFQFRNRSGLVSNVVEQDIVITPPSVP